MDENMETQSAEETTKIQDNISEAEYRRIKVRLQELQRKRTGKAIKWLYAAVAGVTILIFLFLFLDSYSEFSFSKIVISVIAGLVITGFFVAYLGLVFEIQESVLRRKILEYEAENIKEDIKEDIFENAIKMSYKYLDQYYLQTREQAQRGFLVTVCVAIFGAVLIGVGIVTMFLELTQPSVITCAAGVITEFIAAVFFYLYNRTVSSMSKYHNKLVLSQNISIALKIADSLPEQDKVRTKDLMVAELLKNINSYLVKDEVETSK